MNKVYLLIGGNVGDRLQNLQTCTRMLENDCGRIVNQSSVYDTAAWGKTDQQAFLNQALLLHCELSANELLKKILAIEEKMGRKRTERYAARSIDIDILFFNDEVINERSLTVPHPEIQNRRFALEPLHEIAPEFVHPVLQKTIATLLAECSDKLPVKKL